MKAKIQAGKKQEAENTYLQPTTFPDRDVRAFSRVDLIAAIAVVMLLGGWVGISRSGERGRIVRCTGNLRVLGEAMQSFAEDHGSALPPAGISALATTWDAQLAPYLSPKLAKSRTSPSGQAQLEKSVAPKFFCPSDPLRRGDRPRSYAMSSHDMKNANWPPGPDNTTGVGLWWGKDDPERLLGRDTRDLGDLALIKVSWLPDPANTLLLTEYPNKQNRMDRVECIRVGSVREQSKALGSLGKQFHYGRFNYLMTDNHVELLTSLQTGGMDSGHSGIWSVKKGD